MTVKMLDAQAAMGFVVSQTSYIEREVNATQYPDIQYRTMIPVDMSANPWATSVTYYSSDKGGQAQWVSGTSDDIPRVTGELTKHTTGVEMAALGYGYTLEEINQASMLGNNLTGDDAMTAREGAERLADRTAMVGDTSKGFKGLVNHPDVTAISAPNGAEGTATWSTKTADEFLADVNALLIGVYTDTLGVAMANTVGLPLSQYSSLHTKRIEGTSTTLWQYLQGANVYTSETGQPLTIRTVRQLKGAGAGDTDRMVAYRRDPSVLKLHMPMPHRFLPVYQTGPMRFDVPGIMRLGGLDIRKPKEVRYMDGI